LRAERKITGTAVEYLRAGFGIKKWQVIPEMGIE
jgi:hypothetical protein